MSIIRRIPDNSRPRFPQAIFSAPFTGTYDFSIPANTDISILPLQKNSWYMIERFNFVAAIDESVWLESMQGVAAADLPDFKLNMTNQNAGNIYSLPIRCMHYQKNAEHLIYFKPYQDAQELRVTFDGNINQVAGTVGLATLSAFLSFTIYQIWDKQWIQDFEGGFEGQKKSGFIEYI